MRRILVLAHREELIYQAAAHARTAGLQAGVEMGNARCMRTDDVVVSSIQTQIAKGKCTACRGKGCPECNGKGRLRRMEKFNPHEFGLLIIDEGHHATAKSYRLVIEYYRQNPELRILLVTATPKRADGVGLHNVCDSVAYEMDLRSAIANGWLCPIRQQFITVENLDLSNVKTKAGGDLADGELERAFLGNGDIEEERMLHAVAKPCVEVAAGRPLLVFASGCEHAEKLTAAFNAYDDVTAELVLGHTDKDERKRIVKRYKDRETQVLVGVGCFTEGFDAPWTSVVAVARPTKSESLYLQMIGRGTRPEPGIVDGVESAEARRRIIEESNKPICTVLDFVGNSGRHKLVSVADVLAGDDVDPIDLEAALAEAKTISEPVDVEELIEKAKQDRERREKEAEDRRRIYQTRMRAERAEYSAEDVDLFAGRKFDPYTDYEPAPDGATQNQVNALIRLGVTPHTATGYSRRQATAVIAKLQKQLQRQSGTGGDFIVTFGKHTGKRLKDIPKGYINWMIDNVHRKDVQDNIREMRGQKLEAAPF